MFTRLSQVVRARDIQTGLLPLLKHNMTIAEALGHIYERGVTQTDDVFLVQRDDTFVGWVEIVTLDDAWWGDGDRDYEAWPPQWPRLVAELSFAACVSGDGCHTPAMGPDALVESVMSPIGYISADTPVFEAARILTDKVPRAVLEGTEVTGTVDYKDLCKMPFRVLLFALVLELENLAHRLVMQDPLNSWDALNDQSKEQVIGHFYLQQGKRLDPGQIRSEDAFAFDTRLGKSDPEFRFLRDAGTGRKVRVPTRMTARDLSIYLFMQHLTFGDKMHVIIKRRLIRDLPMAEVWRILDVAKRLRNACAHPQTEDGSFEPVEKGDWWAAITDIHRLMASIVKAGNLDEEI